MSTRVVPGPVEALNDILKPAAEVDGGAVVVRNERALASSRVDQLARLAVFGSEPERAWARWVIWELGQAVGIRSASIHELYMARGRGEVRGFTVPAINVRGMAYDTARAIFRTANRLEGGAFILEIARSEIAYTDQRPAEYVAVLLAAALREGFRGHNRDPVSRSVREIASHRRRVIQRTAFFLLRKVCRRRGMICPTRSPP